MSSKHSRVVLDMAGMLVNTRILILDEPSFYLDLSLQIVVAKLIRKVNLELGTAAIVSSYNLTPINDICARILLLDKGRLKINNRHVPGHSDSNLDAYFADAAQTI